LKAIKSKNIQIKVYVEGVKLPNVLAVNVTANINSPAMANITLAPSRGGIESLPSGALVTVFYNDTGAGWKLLFEGLKMASGYQISPTSRTFSIRCVDFTGIWNRAPQYVLNYLQGDDVYFQKVAGSDITTYTQEGNTYSSKVSGFTVASAPPLTLTAQIMRNILAYGLG